MSDPGFALVVLGLLVATIVIIAYNKDPRFQKEIDAALASFKSRGEPQPANTNVKSESDQAPKSGLGWAGVSEPAPKTVEAETARAATPERPAEPTPSTNEAPSSAQNEPHDSAAN